MCPANIWYAGLMGWAEADGNPWFEAPRDGAIACLGSPEKSDPNGPGPLGFQNTNFVKGILKDAGFKQIVAERSLTLLKYPGSVESVAALASNIGPAARILKQHNGGRDDVAAIVQHVIDAFSRYQTPDGVHIPAWLNFFSAVNPTAGRTSFSE